jgi:excisionase family DNA binding protein
MAREMTTIERSKESEILTAAQVAEYLKVHRATIYKLLKAGKLPAFKIGSDYRFKREQIDEWRAAQEEKSK